MSKRIFSCAAMLAVGLLLTSTASANLLGNGDFESTDPVPTGHAAPDWPTFTFTSTSSIDTTMPHGGSQALVEVGGTATTGSTGVFQEIKGVIPGETYELSVWAKAGALPISTDDTFGGAVARIQFEVDGGDDLTKAEVVLGPTGTPGTVRTGNGLLTTEYQKFTASGVAPPTATQLKVQLYSRHSDQAIYFDDADLMGRLIPEPASIGLALFGGLGAFGMRRRSRR